MDEYLSKKNSEGYSDPTAHRAIIRADRFDYRPVIYVCSPYAGDVETNERKAREYCRYVVDEGGIPLAPHLFLPQFLDEEKERDLALFMDLIFLTKCREVWVFGNDITEGMQIEITNASRKGLTVRFITKEGEE